MHDELEMSGRLAARRARATGEAVGCVILVASDDARFTDVVGAMVTEAGFRVAVVQSDGDAALLLDAEPRILVCDATARSSVVTKVLVGAVSRRVPVLLLQSNTPADWARPSARLPRVSSLSFPFTRMAFVAALDGILPHADLHLLPPDAPPGAEPVEGPA